MDPSCAICRAPAQAACDCEANNLSNAIKVAEQEAMLKIYDRVRDWVRQHARDFILEYFHTLTEQRKKIFSSELDRLHAHAMHHFQAQPNQVQLMELHANYKRGIDDDWAHSVQRYPEVLQYYFNLVVLQLPNEDEQCIREPSLSGASSPRKGRRRSANMQSLPPPSSYHGSVAAIAPRMSHPAERPGSRLPPIMSRAKGGMYRPPTAPPGHMSQFYPPPY